MDFKRPSDIGIFDGFTEWWHFGIEIILVILAVGLITLVIYFFDFKETASIPLAIFFIFIALTIVFLPIFTLQSFAKEDARNENVSKVFNVSEDQKYEIIDDYKSKDDVFADVKTSIRDAEAQKMYEVTFGFKESGEPFIYETGDVNKDFIEGLKK